jgi:DNA polymerase-1
VAAKLMLIDGNSLLFRAFFALPLLRTRDGIYTNGVYGFLTMFNRVVKEEQPTHPRTMYRWSSSLKAAYHTSWFRI